MFGKSHQLYAHRRKKWHWKKRVPFQMWNMGEAHLDYSLYLTKGAKEVLNLCKSQWNQRFIKSIWCKKIKNTNYWNTNESPVAITDHKLFKTDIHIKAPKNQWDQNTGLFWGDLQWVLIKLNIYEKSWNLVAGRRHRSNLKTQADW